MVIFMEFIGDVMDISLVSSNVAGWKIPKLNGGSNRKITDFYGPFSIAIFDYRRVSQKYPEFNGFASK